MNNILVTGGDGQLGSELKEIASNYLEYNFLFTCVKTLDITNHTAVAAFVDSNNINVIINCAAYTAVDQAESDPELANAINHLAVANLAQIAKNNNVKFIQISTDYVFDGSNYRPYMETDIPNPQSVYGKTKLDGELAMRRISPSNSVIIRTSWVYSRFGTNFVKTMLNLAKERDEISVVADQIGSPTNAADLAQTILQILPQIENTTVEVYHYTNEGICSWAEFSSEIFKLLNIQCRVNQITTTEYLTKAKRPAYSVMETRKIKQVYKVTIPMWDVSLENMLNDEVVQRNFIQWN
jgi:dTDP-4-dehydrorhamnose reductase